MPELTVEEMQAIIQSPGLQANTDGLKAKLATDRASILDRAKGYVTKDRAATHGSAEDNFATIGNFWTDYLIATGKIELESGSTKNWGRDMALTATDVAAMMILMKVARIATNPSHIDNWDDIAGYAACGGEIACK